MSKLIKWAVCTIRNEEMCINGWARQMQIFAENVVALVDPATTDKTIEILKELCPWVKIEYQDRSLGDSDNEIEGKTNSLIMHNNETKWIQENVADGEWFLCMAADERFALEDLNLLYQDVKRAIEFDFDCVVHRNIIEPINVSKNQLTLDNKLDLSKEYIEEQFKGGVAIDWRDYTRFNAPRFHRKTPEYKHNSIPHSGYEGEINKLISSVPIYHFHRIKHHSVYASNWRDAKGAIPKLRKKFNDKIPIYHFNLPDSLNWGKWIQYTYADRVEDFFMKYSDYFNCKTEVKFKSFNESRRKKILAAIEKEEQDRLDFLKRFKEKHNQDFEEYIDEGIKNTTNTNI